MSKSVRTQWRGCQERGGLPRPAWSRAAGVERGADGPGADASLPEAPARFVTCLFFIHPSSMNGNELLRDFQLFVSL